MFLRPHSHARGLEQSKAFNPDVQIQSKSRTQFVNRKRV
jgi:hypothetical protein